MARKNFLILLLQLIVTSLLVAQAFETPKHTIDNNLQICLEAGSNYPAIGMLTAE